MPAARFATAATAAALALGACDQQQAEPPQPVEPATAPAPVQPQAPQTPPVAYACESGQSVQVQYVDPATTQITYKGQSYLMRPAQAASGARFTGSGLEWWTANRDGQEGATLSRMGPNDDVGVAVLERCARPSAPADPTAAAPGPIPAPGQAAIAGQPLPPVGATPAAAPCRGPQLRLSREAADAGAGQRGMTVGVQNVGQQPCAVSGYPTVQLADARGRVITTVQSEPAPAVAIGGVQTGVLLQPQGKAVFDMTWSGTTGAANPSACPTAAMARVTMPGDTSPALLAQSLQPCGGKVRVSPVRPAP